MLINAINIFYLPLLNTDDTIAKTLCHLSTYFLVFCVHTLANLRPLTELGRLIKGQHILSLTKLIIFSVPHFKTKLILLIWRPANIRVESYVGKRLGEIKLLWKD